MIRCAPVFFTGLMDAVRETMCRNSDPNIMKNLSDHANLLWKVSSQQNYQSPTTDKSQK